MVDPTELGIDVNEWRELLNGGDTMIIQAPPLLIRVYVEHTKTWREFTAERGYVPSCGNGLHQVSPHSKTCTCGTIVMTEPKEDQA